MSKSYNPFEPDNMHIRRSYKQKIESSPISIFDLEFSYVRPATIEFDASDIDLFALMMLSDSGNIDNDLIIDGNAQLPNYEESKLHSPVININEPSSSVQAQLPVKAEMSPLVIEEKHRLEALGAVDNPPVYDDKGKGKGKDESQPKPYRDPGIVREDNPNFGSHVRDILFQFSGKPQLEMDLALKNEKVETDRVKFWKSHTEEELKFEPVKMYFTKGNNSIYSGTKMKYAELKEVVFPNGEIKYPGWALSVVSSSPKKHKGRYKVGIINKTQADYSSISKTGVVYGESVSSRVIFALFHNNPRKYISSGYDAEEYRNLVRRISKPLTT